MSCQEGSHSYLIIIIIIIIMIIITIIIVMIIITIIIIIMIHSYRCSFQVSWCSSQDREENVLCT